MNLHEAALAANKLSLLRRRYNENVETRFMKDLEGLGAEFAAKVEGEISRRMDSIPAGADTEEYHINAVILAMAQYGLNRIALDIVDDGMEASAEAKQP